jgi:hypothetical protein
MGLPSDTQCLRKLECCFDGIIIDGVQFVNAQSNGHQDQQIAKPARMAVGNGLFYLVLVNDTIGSDINIKAASWEIVYKRSTRGMVVRGLCHVKNMYRKPPFNTTNATVHSKGILLNDLASRGRSKPLSNVLSQLFPKKGDTVH